MAGWMIQVKQEKQSQDAGTVYMIGQEDELSLLPIAAKACLATFTGVREGNHRPTRKPVYDHATMRMGVKRDRGKLRNETLQLGKRVQGNMEMQEAGKGESRRQAASVSSRTGGRKKAEEAGGNCSQVLSSTKIVPATWQESVQMSWIQLPLLVLIQITVNW